MELLKTGLLRITNFPTRGLSLSPETAYYSDPTLVSPAKQSIRRSEQVSPSYAIAAKHLGGELGLPAGSIDAAESGLTVL